MYTQVDPNSIVFDFAGTKIKVNNPAESEWVQQAMFANNTSWHDHAWNPRKEFQYLNSAYLYSGGRWMEHGTMPDFFRSHRGREITIQQILDAQQPVFEVGDVVKITRALDGRADYKGFMGVITETPKPKEENYVVKLSNKEHGLFFIKDELELISKAKQQEIIGYELLKDLPGIPAGSKSTQLANGCIYFTSSVKEVITITETHLANTTWFRPIYKPTATVVEISGGRKVTIEGDEASLGDGVEFMSKSQVIGVCATLRASYPVQINTGRKAYELEVLTFKLGCQKFTKDDIVAVRNAFTK